MSALSMTHVSVREGRHTLLDDVSLAAEAGTISAVIGPNGAGKSTLLSVAAGQRTPDDGDVWLGADRLARMSVRAAARRRAMMPQDASVAFAFTVREVVELGRTAQVGSPLDDRVIVEDALTAAGIAHLADREVTTLSGGERQLTALARIVAQVTPVAEGTVVLLDEPTSAMDIAHAESAMRLARRLADDGAAVVTVLHDLDAAAAYADRLVLVDAGRIRRVGAPDQVCTQQLLSEVYGTPIEVHAHAGLLRIGPVRTASVRARV